MFNNIRPQNGWPAWLLFLRRLYDVTSVYTLPPIKEAQYATNASHTWVSLHPKPGALSARLEMACVIAMQHSSPPRKRYGIHTCPTVCCPRAQTTRALELPHRREYRVSNIAIDKFKRLCDFSKRPIRSSKFYWFSLVGSCPLHPGIFCVVTHHSARPEQAVISLFFRWLRRRRPGFLRGRSDPR